jgi:hypothetical protein
MYFRGTDYPSVKKGEKVMIGDNGWLERTDNGADQVSKAPQKKTGILDSIKKMAKDVVCLENTRIYAHTNMDTGRATLQRSSSTACHSTSSTLTSFHLVEC